MDKVRIGILGAARIAPMAIVGPAKAVDEVEVVAIAARDRKKAERFAGKAGIERVPESYDALLADPGVDAVYIPLPNGLHYEWTMKALDAGKHVLCEKPFTSNAAEAERIAERAAGSDRVVMEAFHWRYHGLAERVLEILASGEIGRVSRVETAMCIPLPIPGDIRYRLDLAGGATMDTGCYAIHMLRTFAGEEPVVTATDHRLSSANVDRWMTADFEFPSGKQGKMTCSLLSSTLLRIGAYIDGDEGEVRVFNPVAPQLIHRLKVRSGDDWRTETVDSEPTYTCQLRAFAAAVLRGERVLTPPSESVANMKVIDDVYRAAGLPLRGQSA